jgi:hypothetical protein
LRERIPCEFFLFRYVPDLVKGEFANIGVLLREAGGPARDAARNSSAIVRFTRDWSRVRCMDADADIGLLEALEEEVGRRLRAEPLAIKPMMALLEETFSNSIQITAGRACLAESVVSEMELLMRMHVESRTVRVPRKRSGRAAIVWAMRNQFEKAGVWTSMMKNVQAWRYTVAGDPLKIDCGYRPNGVLKMFHAVSLEADVEAAKVLAYSAPGLGRGVLRLDGALLDLTAIVEPSPAFTSGFAERQLDESDERYRFGKETMQEQGIRVMTVNDLARIAETAKLDLRV